MNVLLVTQHFDVRGGSDVIVQQTKRLLEANGARVFVYAAISERVNDSDQQYPSSKHFDKPNAFNIHKYLYSYEAAKKLDALLSKHKFDISHLHIFYGTITSSIIPVLKKHGVPIIHHLHEYRYYCSIYTSRRSDNDCLDCKKGYYIPGLINRCNRNSAIRSLISTAEMYFSDLIGAKESVDEFLTVSQFQRNLLIRQGLPKSNSRTIYNPVDGIFTLPHKVDSFNRDGVLYVGRIEEYKGVFDVLEVAKQFRDQRFTFVGDGSAMSELHSRVTSMNLSNVTIKGSVTRQEVKKLYSSHKVILILSKWNETFGLTAVEAMSCGTPPIVYEKGGLPEVIEDGISGYGIEVDKINRVAEKLRKLLDDEFLLKTMAAAAQKRAYENFSEKNYLEKLIKCYSEVIERNNAK